MFIFSNLATSLDGKIAPAGRGFFPLGTPADRKQMIVLRRRCDAVLMGASTLRAYKKPCLIKGARIQPYNVVISHSLKGVSSDWPFFSDPRNRRILLVTKFPEKKRLAEFERTSVVVKLSKSTTRYPIAHQIVLALKTLGVRKLLVEGGGGVMWDFVSENLIDEYHVTLTPRLLGGVDAPTLVDGPGLDPYRVVNVKLVRCKRLGDELYLTYKKVNRRGP